MRLEYTTDMTFEAMKDTLAAALPQYEVKVLKNPLAKFEYVEVKKSGTVGVWIRVFDKKGRVQLTNAIPSTAARAFLGGLLLIAFTYGAQSKVRKEAGAVLIEKFNTKEI